MIKFNGLNYPQGSGNYNLFGYFFSGNGSGKGMNSWDFPNPFGSGIGNGYCFGNEIGNGESWSSKIFKEEFLKK